MDYPAENPFEEENQPVQSYEAPPLPEKNQAAPPLPSKDYTSPPPSSSYTQPPSNLQDRAERLRKKEEDLNRREKNLDVRTQILIDREKTYSPRIPNWPRCKPILTHNISEDIPPEESMPGLQRLVRWTYYAWYGVIFCFCFNMIALLVRMSIDAGGTAIADWILSLVYIIFLIPLTFLIYRILYRAARKTKAILYVFYLYFAFPIQILVEIFFAVGIPKTGSGGFFLSITSFDDSVATGSFLMASFGFWTILAIIHILLWIRTHKFHKQAGGIDKARKEMRQEAIRQAKEHPELAEQAVRSGVKYAAENPDTVKKAASYV